MIWPFRKSKEIEEEETRVRISTEFERRVREVNELIEELRQKKEKDNGTRNSTG